MRAKTFVLVLALGSLPLTAWSQDKSEAKKDDAPTKMILESSSNRGGYKVGDTAYTQVVVTMQLGPKGGMGILYLDPNQQTLNAFGEIQGGTAVAGPRLEIKLTTAEKKSDSGGPVVYQIEGEKLPQPMTLVNPKQPGRAYRLILADKDGKPERVILLEPRSKTE